MAKLVLNREQQQFLSHMFDTKDIVLAAEKLQIMLAEAGAQPSELLTYINRLIIKYNAKFNKKG